MLTTIKFIFLFLFRISENFHLQIPAGDDITEEKMETLLSIPMTSIGVTYDA